MIVPLVVELGLHRVEKIMIENGRLLAGRDRDTARATLGQGLAVSAFPRSVPV